MQETNFDRQKAFDRHQDQDDENETVEHSEIPMQSRMEDENPDDKKDHDHTHRMSEAVVEPHVPISTVPLRPWRPWMEAVTLSPHAAGIMSRGIFQPIALLGLPMVWWLGLMYGIYQIWFNSKSSATWGDVLYTAFQRLSTCYTAIGSLISFTLSAPPYCGYFLLFPFIFLPEGPDSQTFPMYSVRCFGSQLVLHFALHHFYPRVSFCKVLAIMTGNVK
jgi:hypothetical protein